MMSSGWSGSAGTAAQLLRFSASVLPTSAQHATTNSTTRMLHLAKEGPSAHSKWTILPMERSSVLAAASAECCSNFSGLSARGMLVVG
mmetsp:Transcript_43677/g.113854  ORF Transcript_43677/g.113854 Transcript_43677/m.113854 type:complete len:88 (+) Transcript_43677:2934-3197(+)